MDAMEKKALYDSMCFALTNYEDPQSAGLTECEAAGGMYDVLVEIQNNWDELMSKDD